MKYSKLARIYYPEKISLGEMELVGEKANHLHNSLRMKIGENFRIFNQNDGEYLARIQTVTRNSLIVRVGELLREYKSRLYLGLALSIIKYENFAKAVDMATQLGVTEIIPIIAERSQAKDVKIDKLEKVLIGAAQQSERLCVPILASPRTLDQLISYSEIDKIFCANENCHDNFICNINKDQRNMVLVGPEGGWSDRELKILGDSIKVSSVSLGDLVLRSETAAVNLLSIIRGLHA